RGDHPAAARRAAGGTSRRGRGEAGAGAVVAARGGAGGSEAARSAGVRVLYVNHTAEVSGGERSLLALLAALPAEVRPLLAAPPGPLTERAREQGLQTHPIRGTAGSLRLHPLHTPRALAEMA